MSEQAQSNKLERRAKLAEVATQIDEISTNAVALFDGQGGGFAKEIAVAQAIVDMRALLTPDIMRPVMALMNTDLGFRTDKDPKIKNWQTGEYPTPYTEEVVREVFIEAKLRGFHTTGNEFNIIAGRFYGAQNGLKRKCRDLTKGTYEPSIDTPVLNGDQARVKCRATWMFNGEKCDIGIRPEDPCEFLVRINKSMGPDAIIGKAERKLAKRVYERITGRTIPEAEVNDGGDSIPVDSTVTSSTPTAETGAKITRKPKATAAPVPCTTQLQHPGQR